MSGKKLDSNDKSMQLGRAKAALPDGYAVVKVGDVPPWMAECESADGWTNILEGPCSGWLSTEQYYVIPREIEAQRVLKEAQQSRGIEVVRGGDPS